MARWISVSAAAKRLGLSTRRVRSLIAEGKLRAKRLGRTGWWRVDAESLAESAVYSAGAQRPPEPDEPPPEP